MRGKRNKMTPNDKGMYEGVVYRYMNKTEGDENGWCYVGNTTDERRRRYSWNNHGNRSYGGKKISDAREKFELENFDYEVLEIVSAATVGELKATLDEKEAVYIKQFNSIQQGYNSSEGGTGNKGGITKEHRKNIGKASKGRKKTQETRDKISASLTGRIVSNETREKISKGNKGKKRSEEANKKQSERMKGKIPNRLIAANKEWRKNGGTTKGIKHTETAKAKMKAAQQANGTKVKVTTSDGTEQYYPTMLDAAKAIGVKVGSIDYYVNKSNTHKRKDGLIFERAA